MQEAIIGENVGGIYIVFMYTFREDITSVFDQKLSLAQGPNIYTITHTKEKGKQYFICWHFYGTLPHSMETPHKHRS